MSIYPEITPTSFVELTQAGLNSNEASITNPFVTTNNLIQNGLSFFVLLSPNGNKWKVSVNNSGSLVVTSF